MQKFRKKIHKNKLQWPDSKKTSRQMGSKTGGQTEGLKDRWTYSWVDKRMGKYALF